MTAPSHPKRKPTPRDLVARVPRAPLSGNGDGQAPVPTSAYFGINTFGARQMRDKLPKDVSKKLAASVRLGKKLDLDIAPAVAQVISEWAISRGVTHFMHMHKKICLPMMLNAKKK